jgi:hypothetical protein
MLRRVGRVPTVNSKARELVDTLDRTTPLELILARQRSPCLTQN